MDGGTDLQAIFERDIMDGEGGYVWSSDWFWADEELDCIGIVEYRLYEQDCMDVLKEDGYY